MKLYLIKKEFQTFGVAYDSDYEKAANIKEGDMVLCEIKKPRNVGHHRKFFTLMNMVFQNQDQYNNQDHLREDLTIEAGFYDIEYNFWGEERKRAKSISFSSMDQTEFQEFYKAFLDAVVRVYGLDNKDLVENIERYYS
jgi:hypothetical protein